MKKSIVSDYVFIDSSMWMALINPRDDFYKEAQIIWLSLKQQKTCVLTTNYILDESFTLIRKRCGRETIRLLRDRLASDWENVKVVRVTINDEAKAWDWFLKDWSDLSFTDCVSFAVMQRLEIKRVATFDRHFTKAGFKVVCPPPPFSDVQNLQKENL